ncbi:YceI family protein [Sphingomonas japonica]|uniref:Polyisoprenoid-binding protein YceI n=1 Tax=Sphingomonas japonica TaxID=511662 RepID=A0ABX0U4R2_9SPHN|nr:YceI family protein [Sphingomonas japonica]NIJ24322.1 polyisoprenoid-binding protein YceI [Sphingomonas japonica]
MRAALVTLALVAATPLFAQSTPQLPGARDASRITGGTYTVDPGHTLVEWSVNHFGFTPYFGLFGEATGTLTLDPKNPGAAKVDITIPVAKVTTASAGLTDHLLRAGKDGGKPDFFGPSPADARFVSTSVTVDGDEAKIAGNLTLNGVTRPVTLEAELFGAGANPMSKKETVGFTADATIKRSEFGILTAIPVVSDEVELDIVAAFEK